MRATLFALAFLPVACTTAPRIDDADYAACRASLRAVVESAPESDRARLGRHIATESLNGISGNIIRDGSTEVERTVLAYCTENDGATAADLLRAMSP